jgi:hypothetical protein
MNNAGRKTGYLGFISITALVALLLGGGSWLFGIRDGNADARSKGVVSSSPGPETMQPRTFRRLRDGHA